MTHWHGIVTGRGGFPWATIEASVARELEARGLRTWMPTEPFKRRNGDIVQTPMVRGLVFAKGDLHWSDIRKIRGYIMPIFGPSGQPAVISDSQIDAMRRACDGYRVQTAINPKMRKGDRVRIRRGALADIEAIVRDISNGKPVVEYQMLGKTFRQTVDVGALTGEW